MNCWCSVWIGSAFASRGDDCLFESTMEHLKDKTEDMSVVLSYKVIQKASLFTIPTKTYLVIICSRFRSTCDPRKAPAVQLPREAGEFAMLEV